MRASWKRTLLATTIVAGATFTTMAGPAHADDACVSRSTKQSFANWGDQNSYFVMTSGTFESGSSGWTLSGGPSVVSAQEPWKVLGNGAKALNLPKNSSARSTKMCVASNEEWLRFFYKSPGVSGSALKVTITVTSSNGTAVNTWAVGGDSAGWNVTPQIYLPNIRDNNGQQWITVQFAPVNTQATWVIDDVQIDPFVSR